MDALQSLAGGQRRLLVYQMVHQPGSDELILDGPDSCRTLRVIGAHVVQSAIGMGNEHRAQPILLRLPISRA
ncbi:MAG: hypothetical protein DI537_62510 [Stutzerimonas stutzeri]|nr:MAG: hypothetical protein DI537_62510 [Stutzerimonas stutzeri]